MREACCTVAYGGSAPKDALWQIIYLPKGYGPSIGDRLVCYVAEPPSANWGEEYGFGSKTPMHPLIAAISATIEAYMKEHPEEVIGRADNPGLSHLPGYVP